MIHQGSQYRTALRLSTPGHVTWLHGESREGGSFTRVKAMICWNIID